MERSWRMMRRDTYTTRTNSWDSPDSDRYAESILDSASPPQFRKKYPQGKRGNKPLLDCLRAAHLAVPERPVGIILIKQPH